MSRVDLRAACDALRAGGSFEAFARSTVAYWNAVAAQLLRRWRAPQGVEHSDMVQELMVAAWRCVPRWNPEAGASIDRFVVFNATDKAKKWLHRQRNAVRRDDKSPGRFPAAFSSLRPRAGDEPPEAALLDKLSTEPDYQGVERRMLLSRALAEAADVVDQCAVLALLMGDGDLESAASMVMEDPALRRQLRLDGIADARRYVVRAVRAAVTVVDGSGQLSPQTEDKGGARWQSSKKTRTL